MVEAIWRNNWSRQQVVGRSKLEKLPTMSVPTLSQLDRREGGDVWRHMRILSKFGPKQRGIHATRGRLVGKRHISERPASVEKRQRR